MCWRIDKREFNKFCGFYNRIADEDVVVYKFGVEKGVEFAPMCYSTTFSYMPNVITEHISFNIRNFLDDENKYNIEIEEGYHSYSGDCFFTYKPDTINDIVIFSQSYSTWPIGAFHFFDNESYIIGKFIIPKGTEYFINHQGEIVSSQLIWTGETTLMDDIEVNKVLRISDTNFGV